MAWPSQLTAASTTSWRSFARQPGGNFARINGRKKSEDVFRPVPTSPLHKWNEINLWSQLSRNVWTHGTWSWLNHINRAHLCQAEILQKHWWWTWMIVCANAHPFEHILVSLQFFWCKHQGTSICLDSLHHHLWGPGETLRMESNKKHHSSFPMCLHVMLICGVPCASWNSGTIPPHEYMQLHIFFNNCVPAKCGKGMTTPSAKSGSVCGGSLPPCPFSVLDPHEPKPGHPLRWPSKPYELRAPNGLPEPRCDWFTPSTVIPIYPPWN